MVFRVTQSQIDGKFLMQQGIALADESQILEKLSTFKKVNRASDNPGDANLINQAKNDIGEATGFRKAIEATLSRFQAVETAFTEIRDVLDDARELVVEGSLSVNNPERQTIADQLGHYRAEIIDRLNVKHEGQFLFDGTVQVATPPFDDPVTGAYTGNNSLYSLRLNAQENVVVNWPGSTVAFGPGGFGSSDDVLFLLQTLEDAFRADDLATIDATLPLLAPADERINGLIGEVGALSGRLISEQDHYENFELGLREVLQDLESADLAEEAVYLKQARNKVDAQLRAQGSVNRQSLLDFLG